MTEETTNEQAVELTLDEFCMRLSNKDRRVEMIGGFHAHEKAAGRVKGGESDFQQRYDDFINKPV